MVLQKEQKPRRKVVEQAESLHNEHVVYTDRQGLKGGEFLRFDNSADIELRRAGKSPPKKVLKERFEKNKERHRKNYQK
jgi:hypothetical protein